MKYIVIAVMLLFVGCSIIHITADGEKPINVQTTESLNVFGSQNVTSSDRASKESAGGEVSTKANAESVPTTTITPLLP